MTLKDIEKEYIIRKYEDKYLVSSKEVGNSRMVHKYLCSLTKVKNGFVVGGFSAAKNIETLKSNIEQYVKELGYDSEYDYPIWKKGLKEDLMVHDYLTSIGFRNKNGESYTSTIESIYGGEISEIRLWFRGLDPHGCNELPAEVKICASTESFAWTEVKVKRDFDSIKGGIKSLLRPFYEAILFETQSKLDEL